MTVLVWPWLFALASLQQQASPWLLALASPLATFALGCIIGYGRASSRLGAMEAQITALQRAVDRLENLMLGKS